MWCSGGAHVPGAIEFRFATGRGPGCQTPSTTFGGSAEGSQPAAMEAELAWAGAAILVSVQDTGCRIPARSFVVIATGSSTETRT